MNARPTRRQNVESGNRQCEGYGITGGRVEGFPVLIHVGWPKPAELIPVPPLGLGVMSKMMLSGCAGSPETPLTAGRVPAAM